MKYILLLVHTLTISIYSFFFIDPVVVKTSFPESAKPGTEFTAKITINKNTLAGFAKFQLELPQGMSAKEGDSKGGSFTLSGQTAKIIWTSVPSSPEFDITMIIVVDASASGDKVITGKYSYIENNNKQQSEIAPATVKIEGGATAATTTTETTTTAATTTTQPDYVATSTATAAENATPVNVKRTISPGSIQGEYFVDLAIKKDVVKGFAKLEETIPTGFTAVVDKKDEANFSYNSSNQLVKFIWTSVPAREELTISYKLVPKKNAKETGTSVVGEFSYLENQQSKKYTIEKQDLTQTATTPTETVATTNTTTTTEPVNTNTVAATNTVEPVNTNTATTEPVKTETTTPVTTTEPVKTETTTPVTTTADNSQKNSNVHYSVQVGAFRNGVNVSELSSRYSLSGVNTEMQDGLTKCIIGKHGEYKEARDARETVKSKGVSDAFVTAYNSGRRITVQEALMITSQKWFR